VIRWRLGDAVKQTVQFFLFWATPPRSDDSAVCADFGFDSAIFTPMLLGDKVVGAIRIARHEPVGFDESRLL
jgi:hypothetical protein